jgi:hypothetical protein
LGGGGLTVCVADTWGIVAVVCGNGFGLPDSFFILQLAGCGGGGGGSNFCPMRLLPSTECERLPVSLRHKFCVVDNGRECLDQQVRDLRIPLFYFRTKNGENKDVEFCRARYFENYNFSYFEALCFLSQLVRQFL